MTTQNKNFLNISNFKSLDSLEIPLLNPFLVYAGPNGSGKSNLFDALEFLKTFLGSGIEDALRKFGGFENIHSVKRRKEYSHTFAFEISYSFPSTKARQNHATSHEWDHYHYSPKIHELDQNPRIEESLSKNSEILLRRKKDSNPLIRSTEKSTTKDKEYEGFPQNYSASLLLQHLPIVQLLKNTQVYRIDPIRAKEPNQVENL